MAASAERIADDAAELTGNKDAHGGSLRSVAGRPPAGTPPGDRTDEHRSRDILRAAPSPGKLRKCSAQGRAARLNAGRPGYGLGALWKIVDRRVSAIDAGQGQCIH